MKKYIGELIGSFFIVFVGIGSLLGINFMVSAMGMMLPYGFSTFLAAASFGGVTAVMYYVFNKVTGGHFNPAITLAVFIEDGVKRVKDLILYIVSQIMGSTLAVLLIGFMTAQTKNLGQVGYGELSPLYMGTIPAVIVEFLLSVFVVLVFLTVREKRIKGEASYEGAATVIGISVFSAYSFSILATGGGLNPAKILASAIVAKGTALSQSAIFFFIPFVAGVIAFLLFKCFVKDEGKKNPEKEDEINDKDIAESDTADKKEANDKLKDKDNTDDKENTDNKDVYVNKKDVDVNKDKDLKDKETNEEIQAILDEEILAIKDDE